jgi:hypothetical protein
MKKESWWFKKGIEKWLFKEIPGGAPRIAIIIPFSVVATVFSMFGIGRFLICEIVFCISIIVCFFTGFYLIESSIQQQKKR